MAVTPVALPADATAWLSAVFGQANATTSGTINTNPNVWETTLDQIVVTHLSTVAGSLVRFPSDWGVRIETHFLGGARHFRRWEIADIGLLVTWRRAGRRVRTKAALLQSKRLYPNEQKTIAEAERQHFMWGFGRLFEDEQTWDHNAEPRTFTFTRKSRYRCLVIWDEQTRNINHWQREFEIPVYYLLYNPWMVPWRTSVPLSASSSAVGSCDVGCRVIPSADVLSRFPTSGRRRTPTYDDIAAASPIFAAGAHRAGWRLEHFVVDLVLGCQQGLVVDTREEELLRPLFFGRAGPIAAAISLTIDAPENANLGF